MKTIKNLVAVFLMSFTGFVMVQDVVADNRENTMFGLKVGLNYSNVFDSKTEEFHADPKLGFAAGMFVSIPIDKHLGVQPEILISQKGFKGTGVLLGSEYTFTRTTTFIDIPIQFAVKPSENLTIFAGPQYSYLINRKDVFNSTLVSFTQEQEFKNDNIRKNIFGIVTGLDINLKQIVLSTRFGWDLINNNGDGSSNTPRYKNTWFQTTIGYTF